MNEILWICFAVLDLTMVVILYRLFGKTALYGLIVFNLILCNIQVLKTIELFGLTTTLGNVLYASVFLSTDLLSEFHGRKAARDGVLFGFVVLGMATVYMQLALAFKPAAGDFVQPHLAGIFEFMPRLALASMTAYLVSQLHDVWAFHMWKRVTKGSKLWLRNNLSTLVSQGLDSAIFCLIAFWGVFETNVLIEIFITTYLFKAVVALLDTPFIYLAKRLVQPGRARATGAAA